MPRILFSLVLLFGCCVLPLRAQREITVDVDVTTATLAVRVSASPEALDRLANVAFESHGRYRRVTSNPTFDIRFTAVAGNRVQVDVARGGSSVLSRTVTGTSLRHALLEAADDAVEATSGLTGFFASKLAFVSQRTGQTEIYTGDLFFGEVRQITSDRALAMNPRWAPDGSRLLYTSFHRSNAADIFQIDLGTMQRSSFVRLNGTNQGARFSPDGAQVAMALSGEGNPEIYVSNAQGRRISRRTRTSGVESSPVWSPDGRRLLFVSDSAGGPQLYVMPAAGGRMSRLPTNISRYCAEPDWSRGDPNKIAFTARIGRGFQIGLFDLSAREAAKQVSNAPFDALEPVWLADGRHLLFTARSPNQRSIWLLDTESGKSTRLSQQSLGLVSQTDVLPPQ